MRSGDRAVRPLDQRTCSTIGLPSAGGAAVSARSTNGFHSAYRSVSIMTAHTTSRGASMSMRAWGRVLTGSS